MLDDLVDVIETLQRRIRDHGPNLRENETRTRMALIDPLLRVLGWDVSDPSVVTPEYNIGNGRADYALLDGNGRPAALIEAKHFSEPLERANHQEQVFTYALMQQVRYAGLTDGDRWILDDVSVFSGDRRILDLSISNTPSHECALHLLLLWRPNLASGRPVPAREPIVSEVQAPVQEETSLIVPESLVASGTMDVPQQAPNVSPSGWVSLAEYSPPSGGTPPTSIRYANGVQLEVKYWFELVSHTAEWLWTKRSLTHNNVPVQSSTRSKISIVSTDPVHQSGDQFRNRKDVAGTPLIVEGHGSGRDMRERTKRLLNHCGVDPSEVLLRVG